MYFKKRSLEEYRHEIVDTYYHTACINTYISLNQFNAVVRLAIRDLHQVIFIREPQSEFSQN